MPILAIGSAKPSNLIEGEVTKLLEGANFNIADDGLVTVSLPVQIRARNPLAAIPAKGTLLDVTKPDQPLKFTSATGNKTAVDTWEGVFNYMGVPANDSVIHTYGPADGDTEQPHITTHPDYSDNLKQHAEEQDGQFQHFPASGTALTQHLTGITSYHNPNMTFRHTIVKAYSGGGLDAELEFNNIGKIFSTDDINTTTDALPVPTINGADGGIRDWLLLRPSIEILGGAVRITRTYVLSGPYGWNPNIYQAATIPTP